MNSLDKMHIEYGFGNGVCKDCVNLIHTRYSRTYIKCVAYGVSSCEATDWRGKWNACGLKGIPFDTLRPPRRPLVEVRMIQKPVEEEACSGQVTLEELNDGN